MFFLNLILFLNKFFLLFPPVRTVIEELYNYKRTNQIDAGQFVDDNLKMVAFNFVKKQSQQLVYKMIAQTFDLIPSKCLFIDKLKEMIAEHYYKEVRTFEEQI